MNIPCVLSNITYDVLFQSTELIVDKTDLS